MMLRISLNSINPAVEMFKSTLKKNIGLLLLSVAGVLLICPGYMMVQLNSNQIYSSASPSDTIGNWISGLTLFVAILAAAGVFIYNLINFSYLFSRKSSDVFHSLPLTRGELLFSRSLVGLTATLAPVTVMYISLIFITVWQGCFGIFIKQILLYFFYTIISTLMFWAMSLLFAICAGSAFDYTLSFVGANVGLILMGVIFHDLMGNYLLGYAGNGSIIELLSPAYYSIISVYRLSFEDLGFQKEALPFIIRNVILTAVFVLVSYVLYNRRKAEKADTAYAFRFIYLLCGFIASFCGAYAIGILFSENDMLSTNYWVFSIIGGVLVSVAYGAVTNRGFKNFKRAAIIGISAVAVTAIIFTALKFDIIGFSSKIPSETQIKSASVEGSFGSIEFNDSELPLSIHKKIINNKDTMVDTQVFEGPMDQLTLTYTLKNGSTMARRYSVDKEKLKKEYEALYTSDERFNAIYSAIKEYKVDTVDFWYFNDNKDGINTYLTVGEFNTLLKIYQTEFVENPGAIWEQNGFFGASLHNKNQNYSTNDMAINKDFTKTIAYLDSLDLKTRAEQTNKENYDVIKQ